MLFKKKFDIIVSKLAQPLPDLKPIDIIKILPQKTGASYELPCNMQALPSTVKIHFHNIVNRNPFIPSRQLFLYKNVCLSWQGIIFNNFHIASQSLCYHYHKNNVTNTFLLKQWLAEKTSYFSKDVVAVVHDHDASANYYHWLIEVCPRILVLREKYPDCTLLVPGPIPEYILQTTKALGYEKLLSIDKNEIIKASQVILAEHTSEHKDFNLHQDPVLTMKVRGEILRGLNIKKSNPFRHVYVSRSRQKMRRLINEDEVLKILSKHNFEVVYFEDIAYQDQIQLMHETKLFIGIHGANLTNMMFMQPGATTLEIINTEALNTVYFRIASYVNISYCCLPSEGGQLGVSNNDSDLKVDLKEFELLINNYMVIS